jgi:hypothetical protein
LVPCVQQFQQRLGENSVADPGRGDDQDFQWPEATGPPASTYRVPQ